MEKLTTYLILSVGTGMGAYIPVVFGESAFGGWSILGTLIGGGFSIYIIYKLNS